MEQRGAAAAPPEQELPGFRFHPTEEELLEFYLKQVAGHGKKLKFDIIPTVHLYRHDPWDLPALAAVGEREWYFFVPRDVTRKQQQGGGRPSRTTERGFWKATGSDRAVRCAADPRRLVGLKKTLVYYEGRAPRGTKTDWVMNEYRLPDGAAGGKAAEDVVLCKVYRKAVSLKELEQRVAMEELARSAASTTTTASTPTPSSHSAGSPAISSASTDITAHHHHYNGGATTTTPTTMSVKEEEEAVPVLRTVATRPPQLEVAKGLEWLQDPFLTQLRSPWMESLSPYYAGSVLNFDICSHTRIILRINHTYVRTD